MWGRDKIKRFSGVIANLGAAFLRILLLVYFVMTIAIVGFIFAYCISIPLFIVGRRFNMPRAVKFADRAYFRGVKILMALQPWFNLNFEGPDVAADRPDRVLLVSNHRSHLDAFILFSHVTGVRILSKKSLLKVPGLGLYMKISRQIPVERGIDSYMKSMETVRERLLEGEVVHVFPEMTRCQPGFSGTMRFSIAPFHVAYQERIPILPLVFKGTDAVWPKGQIGLNFGKPITAKRLETIMPEQFKSAQELKDAVQSRIERELLG